MEKYNLAKNKGNIKKGEVKAIARKRQYTLAFKKKILQQAAECKEPGSLMALLRREGLASSTLHSWRVAAANGELRSSRDCRRGPEKTLTDKEKADFQRLRKENAALKKRVERAEAIIDLQKKIAEVMNPSPTENNGDKQ